MPPRPLQARLAPALAIVTLPFAVLVLSGCSTLGYYSQAIGGHLVLMRAREPIATLLAADDTDPELRAQLETLMQARAFGVAKLGLPDNDSYSSYVATGRRAVTWNVVAAGEFSLRPRTWCFPVAGCVSYRGYFDQADAQAYAAELAAVEGLDVTVGGAAAYSTLGWFDDPILDTMLRGGELRYVGTLFHELAHQVVYVKGDSDFNEAYASFVEQAGMRDWLRARGEAERIAEYEASLSRGADFVALLTATRARLVALYDEVDLAEEERRARKQAVFDALQADYVELKVSWNAYAGYDSWFARDINNARLVAVATYRRFVPAFAALYAEAGGDMARFHALAADIADLPSAERKQRMEALLADDHAAMARSS